MTRTALGVLLAPLLYVIIWTLPLLEHSTFQKWVVINTFLAYFIFFCLAGISHMVLRKLNATKIGSYCIVMFFVAVFFDLTLSIWSLSGYTSKYYSQTQVVEYGLITKAGYMLQLKEALTNGVISSCVMAIFWLTAIYEPNEKIVDG